MALNSLSASYSITSYLRRSDAVADAIYRISSGNRFARSADDVGAISVAAQLQSQIAASRGALSASNQASSLLQVAYGGLNEISGLLTGLRELATTANSGVLTDADRGLLNAQFQSLREQIDRIASTTRFGERNLLDGSSDGDDALSFPVNGTGDDVIEVAIPDVGSESLFEGEEPNLLSQNNAADAIDVIDDALATLGNVIADVGAAQQGVGFAGLALQNGIGGLSSARESLVGVDIATESTNLVLQLVRQQTAAAILAQTRGLDSGLLDLLGGQQDRAAPTFSAKKKSA